MDSWRMDDWCQTEENRWFRTYNHDYPNDLGTTWRTVYLFFDDNKYHVKLAGHPICVVRLSFMDDPRGWPASVFEEHLRVVVEQQTQGSQKAPLRA